VESGFPNSPSGLDVFRKRIELHGYPLDALQVHALQLLTDGRDNATGTAQSATKRHGHYVCFSISKEKPQFFTQLRRNKHAT